MCNSDDDAIHDDVVLVNDGILSDVKDVASWKRHKETTKKKISKENIDNIIIADLRPVKERFGWKIKKYLQSVIIVLYWTMVTKKVLCMLMAEEKVEVK
jgi:hypothetical protein